MQLNHPAGALFDLDGVLIDTEGQYSIFWAETGRKYNVGGPTFSDDIKGTNLALILALFPEEVREQVRDEIHHYEHVMDYPLYPGALELLESLHAAGIPIAIFTSSDNMKMELLFKRHPEVSAHVDAIITGDMVTRSKPDPEGYIKAAAAIGRDIERCYVFEDSMQGLEAGRRSGARVIGVATTNSADMIAPLSHAVIPSVTGFTAAMMLEV
ncbi:MAG: HAD family hydrolase [Duncaniella sp.]|nr:HAD family hydrolase [Duncaniella sp.]